MDNVTGRSATLLQMVALSPSDSEWRLFGLFSNNLDLKDDSRRALNEHV